MIYPTADEIRRHAWRCKGVPSERLTASYTVDPDGCWRWTRGKTTSGYGHFHMLGRYFQAHLIAYILHVGPLPAGLEPDHLCRNRACVNPDHLEFVTHAVNVQRGSQAILTAGQVDTIRAAHRAGQGVRALARKYSVNHATVSRIVNGHIWRDRLPTETTVAA